MLTENQKKAILDFIDGVIRDFNGVQANFIIKYRDDRTVSIEADIQEAKAKRDLSGIK